MKRFLLFALLLSGYIGWAQSFISQQEDMLSSASGFERLEILKSLTKYYTPGDSKKARKYGRQANILADNFITTARSYSVKEQVLIVDSKLAYGEVLLARESYLEAERVFQEAQEAASVYNYLAGISMADNELASIDSLKEAGVVKENFFNRTLADIDIGSAISKSTNSVATASELKLGQLYENRGDTAVAIQHYEKAAELLRNRGEIEEAEEIEAKVDTFREIQRVDSLRKEILLHPDSMQKVVARRAQNDTSGILILPKKPTALEIETHEALDDLRLKAEESERGGDFASSLNYYKQYLTLQQKYYEDSVTRVAAMNLANSRMEQLKQQNEIADLNIKSIQQEKEAEAELKNILLVAISIVALATIWILFMYFSKRKKHKMLTTAYSDLGVANNKLEEAEQRISNLLSQQVSPEIASALIEDKPQLEKQFVAVMFLDIRDFTRKAEKMDPVHLIEYQNNVFGFMIEIIREMHGNINQFMGDGFMATFGAPVSHGNDAQNAFVAGVRILEQIKLKNASGEIPETRLGIGIHAGYVVTGNVGTESRKQFSVTGNTVIIAARIEQLNKKYGSQMIVTEDVYATLDQTLAPPSPEFITVELKGRSEQVKILLVDEKLLMVND